MNAQLGDRTKYLGATDIAAILGLSPYRSPWQVWAEKTGRLDIAEAGDSAAAGVALEPVVLAWAERQLGPIAPGGAAAIDGTPIVCHPDGRTTHGEPVEAKTTGIFGPVHGPWGDAGTDHIPEPYLVQAHVQIAALAADVCYLPALLGGVGYRMYQVERDSAIEETIIERACRWWRDHVVGDTPPEQATPPTMDVLRRLHRVPRKTVPLADDVVREYEAAVAAEREAAKRAEAAKAAIIAALGDAEAGELPDGRVLTYYEQTRREYTVAASKYRVLRIAKGGRHE